jgi:outer membrane lipoprotein-sorting protein
MGIRIRDAQTEGRAKGELCMDYPLRWVFGILASFLICAGLAVADDAPGNDAGKILKQTEDTYRGLASYRFEGTTISETKIGGSVSKSETSFVVAFQKPNKFRVEYVYPTAGNWVRVSDGKTTWKTRSLTKESTQNASTDDDLGILDGSPVSAFWNIDVHATNPAMVGSESIDVNGKAHDCFVIQVPPQPGTTARPGMEAMPVKLWIDKTDHLVLREVSRMVAQGGKGGENVQTLAFTKAEVNQAVSDDMFHLAKR